MSEPPCPACGTVNEPGARFCRACGVALSPPAAAGEDQSLWAVTRPGGQPVPPPPPPPPPPAPAPPTVLAPTTAQPLVTEQVAAYPAAVVPPPERRTSSGLIVAIVASSLAVVLLIVAIVLVLARGDDGEQTTSTSRPSLPPTTTPVTETTVPTTTAAPATTAPPAAATTVPSGAATTTPPVAPSTTVFGDLGFPGLPMTRPACDGSYITIVASLFGSDVAALTADALAEYPGTQYLRTDQTCPSLRPDVDGFPIYVVYFGPFRGTNEACPARALGPADAYVKQLSTALPPNHVVSC